MCLNSGATSPNCVWPVNVISAIAQDSMVIGSFHAIDVNVNYVVMILTLDFGYPNLGLDSVHSNYDASCHRDAHVREHHFSILCVLLDAVVPSYFLIWPNSLLNYSLGWKIAMPSNWRPMDSKRSVVVATEMVSDVRPLPYSSIQLHDFEVLLCHLHCCQILLVFYALPLEQPPLAVNDDVQVFPYRDLIVPMNCQLEAAEIQINRHRDNGNQMVAYFVDDSMGLMMN